MGTCKRLCRSDGKIINYRKPDDFVIATNHQKTIKEFVNIVCKKLNIKIKWKGKGLNERAISQNGQIIIKVNKRYFRPLDVQNLRGNYSKAKKILKWKPKIPFSKLIDDMIDFEMKNND